jgi:hypothetical protein
MSAACDGQLPGLPEELMSIGAIVLTIRAHDARDAAYRPTLPVSDPLRQARINPVTPTLPGVG